MKHKRFGYKQNEQFHNFPIQNLMGIDALPLNVFNFKEASFSDGTLFHPRFFLQVCASL